MSAESAEAARILHLTEILSKKKLLQVVTFTIAPEPSRKVLHFYITFHGIHRYRVTAEPTISGGSK
jgi:hypothetical protein